MKNTIVKFGLVAGIITALLMIITMIVLTPNVDSGWGLYIGYASMIIAFSTIFIGIRSYRERVGVGHVTFIQGLMIGIGITTIATLFYVGTWMVYYPNGGKVHMDEYFLSSVEKIKQSGLNESDLQIELDKLTKLQEDYQRPLVRIMYTIMEIFPVGLLISLLAAFILKRK